MRPARAERARVVAADSTAERLAADALPKSVRGPVRTCVGCRSREAAEALLRVVAVRADVESGAATVRLVPDPGHRAVGRGAWLHIDQACVRVALRRRAFGRALRIASTVDPTAVEEYVARAVAAGEGRHTAQLSTRTPKAERTHEHPMKLHQ